MHSAAATLGSLWSLRGPEQKSMQVSARVIFLRRGSVSLGESFVDV
jgi:hypothetical protein